MTEKIYFCLLILCGFLRPGIVQGLSGNVDSDSWITPFEREIHQTLAVRRKRVINSSEGGETPLNRGDAPYVVNIKEFPGNWNICVGSILSTHTVITDAACIMHYDVVNIKIIAGSVYSQRQGTSHNVIEKRLHISDHLLNARGGIALLIVQPAFVFNINISPIALHQGILLTGTHATIFGWGCNFGNPIGTNYRYRLRSITLPIMRHQECLNIYQNRAVITDKHICTYDPKKRCGHTDGGAPLVVDHHLVGVYVWTGTDEGHVNPDVYLIVQHLEFSQWIRNNIV